MSAIAHVDHDVLKSHVKETCIIVGITIISMVDVSTVMYRRVAGIICTSPISIVICLPGHSAQHNLHGTEHAFQHILWCLATTRL